MKAFKTGSLIFLIVGFFVGCSDFTGSNETPQKLKGEETLPPTPKKEGLSSNKSVGKEINKKNLVEDLVNFSMTPQVSNFVEASRRLNSEIARNCQLEAFSSTTSDKEAAIALKFLWRAAMGAYHSIEVMQIGPLAENNFELLDRVYSYPSTNRCAIDIEVYNMATQDSYTLPRATNRLGLDAIEYLIFQTDLNHSCARNSKNLANWDSFSNAVKANSRCNYLKSIGRQLADDVEKIESHWLRFASRLSQGSENELLNQIFFALFYIEKNTKDQTLGIPTGLSKALPRCHGRFCLNSIQHKDSKFTKQLLSSQMNSFKIIFTGIYDEQHSGFGLRDYLLGQKNTFSHQVAKKIETKIANLTANLNKLPSDYDIFTELESITDYELCRNSTHEDRKVEACSLYQDFKSLTDVLKKELTVALSIRLPVDTEGDGD